MAKMRILLACVTTAVIVVSCGPRRDAAKRVLAGDSVRRISITGFTNGVPIALTVSDIQSLKYITEGIRHANDSPTFGNVFEANLTLDSGYTESVMLMIKDGGGELTFGTGSGLLKEPTWHTIRIGPDAPEWLATNVFYLSRSYK